MAEALLLVHEEVCAAPCCTSERAETALSGAQAVPQLSCSVARCATRSRPARAWFGFERGGRLRGGRRQWARLPRDGKRSSPSGRELWSRVRVWRLSDARPRRRRRVDLSSRAPQRRYRADRGGDGDGKVSTLGALSRDCCTSRTRPEVAITTRVESVGPLPNPRATVWVRRLWCENCSSSSLNGAVRWRRALFALTGRASYLVWSVGWLWAGARCGAWSRVDAITLQRARGVRGFFSVRRVYSPPAPKVGVDIDAAGAILRRSRSTAFWRRARECESHPPHSRCAVAARHHSRCSGSYPRRYPLVGWVLVDGPSCR